MSLITIIWLIAGCSPSDTEKTHPEVPDTVSVDEVITTLELTDTVQESISCLEIVFIEQLELSWNDLKSKLAEKGFTITSSQNIQNGREVIFENSKLDNELHISNFQYPDGEVTFKVVYTLTPDQIDCLKEQLMDGPYEKDKQNRYRKRGLGTYEEKTITIDSIQTTISYFHMVGKELSVPDVFPDTMLRRTENRNIH